MNDTVSQLGRSREDFLTEAQELAEGLGRDLLAVDEARKRGEPDPELVNTLFRGTHTLKSLAAMFGAMPVSQVAHAAESLLDGLRLGRTAWSDHVLDRLFEAVEAIHVALGVIRDEADLAAADGLVEVARAVDGLTSAARPAADASGGPVPLERIVGHEIADVLSEYEEHRVRTAHEKGQPLQRLQVHLELASLDQALSAARELLHPVAETITFLPGDEIRDDDRLALEIVTARHGDAAEFERLAAQLGATILPVIGATPSVAPAPVSSPAAIARHEPGLPAAPEPDRRLSIRAASQTVRVDIGKLDRLMNVVGELTLVRGAIAKVSDQLRDALGRRELSIELYRIGRGLDRRLGELRAGILEVRMVPLGQIFERLGRVARTISHDLGKSVDVVFSGAETEVDKLIVEELSDPLLHILRNAIGHGIELPAARSAVGKPESGTVALTAYTRGNQVVIEIEDDGVGIDGRRLAELALARGLMSAEQLRALSEPELTQLVFLPGLSTSSRTDELQGRGVGMDVVKTNIAALGGSVEILSEAGIGTKLTLTLPVTLAILPALMVEVAEQTYAVPLGTVAEALAIEPEEVETVLTRETVALRGETLPLARLDQAFGERRPGPIRAASRVVVAMHGPRRLGLVVDALVGQGEVVVKPLGRSLGEAAIFSGATDLGDGRLALVLDTGAIIDEFFTAQDAPRLGRPSGPGHRELAP